MDDKDGSDAAPPYTRVLLYGPTFTTHTPPPRTSHTRHALPPKNTHYMRCPPRLPFSFTFSLGRYERATVFGATYERQCRFHPVHAANSAALSVLLDVGGRLAEQPSRRTQ
jgi:hypothetical protein